MDFEFTLRGERSGTADRLGKRQGERRLEMQEDPRNYWHIGQFVDKGESFGSVAGQPTVPGFESAR